MRPTTQEHGCCGLEASFMRELENNHIVSRAFHEIFLGSGVPEGGFEV